jgi:(p)ppGpp synthase/HD superfamily hydrolase
MSDAIIFEAIEFACKAHKGQVRKGSRLPYIYHPLNVGRTLLEAGYENDIIVAGFLHDTIEDTSVTREEIASAFGERIASLVLATSEKNKSDTWENRKQETLDELATAPPEVLAISCADKLDNIRSIRSDLGKIGDEIWKRFKRPRESQSWYYTSLASIFRQRLTTEPHESLASSFLKETEAVFGTQSA